MPQPITGKEISAIRRLEESRDTMEELMALRSWLMTYPAWEGTLLVDYTEGIPGSIGLFPVGLEETGRQEDVLGNLQIHCRYRFYLYRQTAGQGDGSANAQWLLEFQNWVQQQSAAGLAPRFGDVPSQERIRAQKGELKKVSNTGIGTYIVTLIADFMKVYEVN